MSRILVLYFSRTGNTRALAEEIARGVEEAGGEALLRSAAEVSREDFLQSDGVAAGSPVYHGSMASDLKRVFEDFLDLRRNLEGKIGAAFATSGDATGGKETTLFSILQAMLINGMIVLGDPLAATGHYGVACVGKPDERTLRNAKLLGARLADVAGRLAK